MERFKHCKNEENKERNEWIIWRVFHIKSSEHDLRAALRYDTERLYLKYPNVLVDYMQIRNHNGIEYGSIKHSVEPGIFSLSLVDISPHIFQQHQPNWSDRYNCAQRMLQTQEEEKHMKSKRWTHTKNVRKEKKNIFLQTCCNVIWIFNLYLLWIFFLPCQSKILVSV